MGITIEVESKVIFVNRQDPTQVSYDQQEGDPNWKMLYLIIHPEGLPVPGQDEIFYRLRQSPTRGIILNVNNL